MCGRSPTSRSPTPATSVQPVRHRGGDRARSRRPPRRPWTGRRRSCRSAATTRSRSRSPRAMHRRHGPIALVHFDAHLDTWDTYFGAAYTHGTPFRRAWEEGLLLEGGATHVGIRGPLFSPEDLVDDERFGFEIVSAMEVLDEGRNGRSRSGSAPASGTRRSTSRSTSTCSTRASRPAPGRRRPEGSRTASCWGSSGPGRCAAGRGGHRRGLAAVRPGGDHGGGGVARGLRAARAVRPGARDGARTSRSSPGSPDRRPGTSSGSRRSRTA